MNKRFLKGDQAAAYKHGHDYSSPTYRSWKNMKNRCTRPTDKQWADYGGRGIKVCDKWMKFDGFLEDMWVRPAGMTLDRIDNNGNYELQNCRWASLKTQRSNRRDNHIVEYKGEKVPLVVACELANMPYGTVICRINRYGWSDEKALTYPVRSSGRVMERNRAV